MRYLTLTILVLWGAQSVAAQHAITRWVQVFDSTSAFSSPVAIDLNRDGFQDIVLGCGQELDSSATGLIALNGRTGTPFWVLPSRSQLYAQPLFLEITGDSTLDILIAGRFGQLYAVDGENGTIIWSFFDGTNQASIDSGWYNFYSPIWIPDQNGDQIPEILISSGGDPFKSPIDSMRPPGSLLVINPQNGSLLVQAEMPDGKETYFSPLLIDSGNDQDPWILFGSGGETVRGDLWKISLSGLMQGSLQGSVSLLSGRRKGMIALPSMADLTQDGVVDYIVPRLDEALVAIDGSTNAEIWSVEYPGHEFYLSPTIGQFTGDGIPDALVHVQQGTWPLYQGGFWMLVDGSTGQVVWTRTSATYQFASAMAVDADQDGFDEMIFVRNFFTDLPDSTRVFRSQVEFVDFQSGQILPLTAERDGMDVFSTPLLTDLDSDGLPDLIYASNNNTSGWYESKGITVYREELTGIWPEVAWGQYLGNEGNGVYQIRLLSSVSAEALQGLKVLPDPLRQRIVVSASADVAGLRLFDLSGKLVGQSAHAAISTTGLPEGIYIVEIETKTTIQRLKISLSAR